MRSLFILFLILQSMSSFAQRIETEIDGRLYSCTPREGQTPSNPGGVIDCIDAAYRGPFTRDQSEELCLGARNDAPARCAIAAYAGPFTKDESIKMCKGARSNGPIECYVKAYAGPFTKEQSMRLCSIRGATVAHAECAIKAYSGRYTKEEAITLCSGSNKSKSIINLKIMDQAEFEDDMIKAVQKAVLEGTYKK
jgi:hypothetical protein